MNNCFQKKVKACVYGFSFSKFLFHDKTYISHTGFLCLQVFRVRVTCILSSKTCHDMYTIQNKLHVYILTQIISNCIKTIKTNKKQDERNVFTL